MACTARVLVVEGDSSAVPIGDKLEDHGFHSLCAATDAHAIEIAGKLAPDVAIIHTSAERAAELDLGLALKRVTPSRSGMDWMITGS